ncbi:Cytosolic beta-glucosidase [Heracleum sosnowskyi]|uniref:Cytosolic beta-glucosidase n=1 Tax=Heracleum sosnowskyi TaxID=360622 RepID=A0AAD8MBE1_9APIA|nr:Cytosolic beta-glucosidase [Heracleum sosnowskyi]
MASCNYIFESVVVLTLAFVFCIQGTLGGIACENLNKETCAYAISSSGNRCVLEQRVRTSGEEAFTCSASEIEAGKLKDYIERDECIRACGLQRDVNGISSDSLLEPHFARKLCSTKCYNNCPNIIDLYFNLAAGEGLYLPKLCESQKNNARRRMVEIRSSGRPVGTGKLMVAEGPNAVGELMEEADAPEADNKLVEVVVDCEAPTPALF